MNKQFELSQVEKAINKKYGEVIKPASFIKDRQRNIFSIGPKLDFALNGGIPSGTLCILSGKKKCGKSTSSLQLAGNFQEAGRKVFYGDFEYRWKKINAYGIHNFDPTLMHFIRSAEPKENIKILTAEEKLHIMLSLMKDIGNNGSLFIIDSLSAICPEDVLTAGNVSGSRRSNSPKLITDFLKQAAPYIQVNDLTVVCITHLISNTSGYGSPFMEDGGNYVQYQCDVHLRCTKNPVIYKDKNDKEIGQVVTWDIITSALGPPREKIESIIRYGYGIDDIAEYIEMGIDLGIIEQSGAWCSFNNNKVQGRGNLRDWFLENPDKYQILKTQVKEVTII